MVQELRPACLQTNVRVMSFSFLQSRHPLPLEGATQRLLLVQELRPACMTCRGIVFGLHITCCPRAMEAHEWVGEATGWA